MGRIQDVRKTAPVSDSSLRARDQTSLGIDEPAIRGPIALAVDGLSQEGGELHAHSELEQLLSRCPQLDWNPDPDSVLFLGGKNAAESMEEFRALRFRLYDLRKERHFKTLLVTSSVSGEGRSFVAANLAQVLALQSDTRVLLIDGDLRRPNLHSLFGTSIRPGLSEFMLKDAEVQAITQRGQEQNLFFIPAGGPVAAPTELLANGRLHTLIRQVEPAFAWIIIDSPAAGNVSDACAIANFCDGVLFVVRSESTPYDVARKAQEKFSPQALIGVVLNRVEAQKTSAASQPDAVGVPETNRRSWLRWRRTAPEEP